MTSTERRLPPVTELGMASLALIVAGGIYLSAHLPEHVPLAPGGRPAGASALLLAGNLLALARVEGFAWDRFFEVGKWALLAYAITAGMIEYAFVHNHVRGGPLVVLTLSLVVYAVPRADAHRVHGRALRGLAESTRAAGMRRERVSRHNAVCSACVTRSSWGRLSFGSRR